MNGWHWSIATAAVTVLLAALGLAPGGLRQADDDRIAALETTVAEHGGMLATLVASPAPGQSPTRAEMQPGDGQIVLAGQGDTVTEPFELQAGVARFSTDYQGERHLSVWLYREQDGARELVFNEIGPYQGTKVVTLGETTDYYLGVENPDAWSIVIEQ